MKVVPENDVAVGQGEPGHRLAPGILQFHANAPRGRGGEAVDSQRMSSKLVAVLLVRVFTDEDRNLARGVFDRGF